MKNTKYISAGVALTMLASVAIAIPALADTSAPATPPSGWQGKGSGQGGMRGGPMMKPAVFGTVTAVSGNTISINAKQGFGSTTPTTAFTVDATNATVKKNNATSTVSSIAVGDTIVVQGTVSGTNVTATAIMDGMMRGPGGMRGGQGGHMASSTPIVQGNGQPIVAGKITAISGSTLTISNNSNVAYTIDASNAKVFVGQNTASTLSSVAVGDQVVVQGTVNGTSVTATTIVDQTNHSGTTSSGAKGPGGFFAGIGSAILHFFGF